MKIQSKGEFYKRMCQSIVKHMLFGYTPIFDSCKMTKRLQTQ